MGCPSSSAGWSPPVSVSTPAMRVSAICTGPIDARAAGSGRRRQSAIRCSLVRSSSGAGAVCGVGRQRPLAGLRRPAGSGSRPGRPCRPCPGWTRTDRGPDGAGEPVGRRRRRRRPAPPGVRCLPAAGAAVLPAARASSRALHPGPDLVLDRADDFGQHPRVRPGDQPGLHRVEGGRQPLDQGEGVGQQRRRRLRRGQARRSPSPRRRPTH